MLSPLFITLALIFSHFVTSQMWDYASQYSWEGTCNTGQMQSPIDIPTTRVECSDYDVFSLTLDDSVPISFQYEGDKWTQIQSLPYGSFEAEDIDGIVQLYRSSGASLHTYSEHLLDSKQAQIEIQFEFELDVSDSPSSSDRTTAIVSILLNRVKDDTLSQGFMDTLDMFVLENRNDSYVIDLKMNQIIAKLLIDPQNFIMYQGSLTRPDCAENVNWYVVEAPVLINDDELDFLLNVTHSNSTYGSSRGVQKLNDRPLKKICAVTSRAETLLRNPCFYFLTILIIAGFFFWQSYGRIPPEEGKTFYADLWTIHPILSIINIPNKQSFSRRCRIALLYVTWLVQMLIECLAFRIQGYYKDLYILYFALLGIAISIPVSYGIGFFFRMYSKRANENERLMHYDTTAMHRYMKTFKLITLCSIVVGLLFLYWQIAYLVGILAREWILSFLLGVTIDLCVLDCLAVFISFKSDRIASFLKLRGYYFEGDISFYSIL